MSWRGFTDWAKESPAMLRVADRLGRGRGRTRVLDHLSRPPAAKFKPDLSDWEKHSLAAVWLRINSDSHQLFSNARRSRRFY
jgi:hypothetical protein